MLFLTSLLDQPVEGQAGEIIGWLEDLIVRMGDELYPPIAGLVVRDWRGASLYRRAISTRSTTAQSFPP